MKPKKQNNAGFTLIEVLLCIAILALLSVPLLGSFVTTAKINAKSKRDQKAAVLAQNIMESLKATNIEGTALQFNNGEAFQIINSNLNGFSNSNYQLKAYTEDGYGEYFLYSDGFYRKITESTSPRSSVITTWSENGNPVYTFNPTGDRESFLFGIENLLDDGAAFDALINLDTSAYSDMLKYEDTMNNYRMPGLMELNENTVAILDLEGINTIWSDDTENAEPIQHISNDEQAVSDFYNIYLTYEAHHKEPDGIPESDPVTVEDIKEGITKEIKVSLSKEDALQQVFVNCQITYRCSLDLNDDGDSEELTPLDLISGVYPLIPDSETQCYVYVFYTPSEFDNRDSIMIQNDSVKANIYIANQNEAATSQVTLRKKEYNNPITKLYTNLKMNQLNVDFPINDYNLITKNDKTDRIYNITVSIYPAGAIKSGQLTKTYAIFTSTKEE